MNYVECHKVGPVVLRQAAGVVHTAAAAFTTHVSCATWSQCLLDQKPTTPVKKLQHVGLALPCSFNHAATHEAPSCTLPRACPCASWRFLTYTPGRLYTMSPWKGAHSVPSTQADAHLLYVLHSQEMDGQFSE